MACAVALHQLDHVLVEELSILLVVHVDEVDDDDASHITETELAGKLFGCDEIDVNRCTFLLGALTGAITAVDIHDVHGLGLLDDQISTALAGDGTSKGRLDLLGDVLLIEDGEVARIETDDVFTSWGYLSDILTYFLVVSLVIDVDALEGGVEGVSQNA